jgi:O-antigen ligase
LTTGVSAERWGAIRRVLARTLAALVVGTSLALPLVFVPGLDDGYALSKTVLLWIVGVIGSVTLLGYLVIGGPLLRRSRPRMDLALIVFIVLTGLSALASTDVGQSITGEPFQYQGLLTVLLYVAAFFLAGLVVGTPERLRALMSGHLVVGGVVAVYAIAQHFGVDPFWSGPPDDRPISSVGQANNVAAYLDLAIVIGIGLWPRGGRRMRTAIGAVLVLSVIGLGLTLSRGGYLALVAGIAAMAVATRWSPSRTTRRRLVAGVMASAVVAVGLLTIPILREPVERVADRVIGSSSAEDGSIRMHVDLWQVGAAIAVDRPFLGTGPETFPLVFDGYLDEVLTQDRATFIRRFRIESPHNQFIGIAAGSGIPALVAYLVFLALVAATCVRHLRNDPAGSHWIARTVLGVLAVHAVSTFFMTPETSTSLVFWVLIGSGLAAMPAPGVDGGERLVR